MSSLLIVALHGRSLARSAKRGGHAVDVLDLYNDRDTRRHAVRSKRVAERNGSFHAAALVATAAKFCPAPAPLVAGSGFEDNPGLLDTLARGRALHGNMPDTIARVKDPRVFFPLLDELAIPHPRVTFTAPENPAGWLVKRAGGHGGTHIRSANACPDIDGPLYFQRLVPGRSCSVLFLANGEKARVIGFNEQFTTTIRGDAYWFAGAINRVEVLHHRLRCEIAGKLDALVSACELKGLNSMDFIATGNEYHVLEINPRPSATMDLYDEDFASGLFDWHLRACAGELPESAPVGEVRAHAVVYAPQPAQIEARFRFPEWCSDIPAPGRVFPRGAPVCMVHASGASAMEVRGLVDQRRSAIENKLMTLDQEAAA